MLARMTCLSMFICILPSVAGPEPPIRVVVWDEQQPQQQQAYPNFLGNAIAEHLRQLPEFQVRSMRLDDADQGLSSETLDFAQVLVWWGHVRHREIQPQKGRDIVRRIKAGQLSLIVLHSAHWSTPFIEAMFERTRWEVEQKFPQQPGIRVTYEFVPPPLPFTVPAHGSFLTPAYYATKRGPQEVHVRVDLPNCCFPDYRPDGAPSTMTVLKPDHPVAEGLPKSFRIAHTEMYNEPFHVPDPDEVIFEETWQTGERFRNGMVWHLGQGKVVYFRPGHETFGVYLQPEPLKVVENAARWLARKSPAVELRPR